MVPRALVLVPALLLPATALAQVHYTYLWHLEQPIYWPAPDGSGNRYQRAWESMQAKLAGAAHPADNLDEIFGKDDRVAAYQWRPKEALATLLGHPEAGVQVSYSGGLIENVRSLASAGALGYAAGWNGAFVEARGWKTSQGTPRMDVVMFPFHHPLLPLTDDRVVRMELALYAAAYAETWGAGATSKGLFPPEMAFSERLIPALADAGLEWVIVSNSHISRACEAYPWVAGSGGDNIPPPNRADVQNPAQAGWNRITIDRGVSPANAYPFSYRPHRARFVDPASGQAKTIIVVPAAQGESWKDGYSCYGLDEAAAYAGASEPDHPILVVLAHDGDNAFGGGYSYYMECVPALANTATSMGYVPTTIAGYLADHPVAADDVVHVEDGAWVNADGDFGAPTFWNWNWPLVDKDGNVDPANGWAEDERNFAVIVAATNWVLTAEDAAGPADPARVLHAESPSATKVERAWHFLLGALNSGYMYYGKALDMELKPVVASNEAVARAKQAIPAGAADKTPPTVFAPQHWPDNPGGLNYGPLYKYKQVELPPRALFWTFAYDVSGVATAVFRYRLDADGKNPLGDDANETYAGGAGIDAWEALPMAQRAFPKENVTNDPEFDTSVLPAEIADVYWVELTGVADRLVDWYVEVADEQGNVTRTPIRHLYVGSAGGDPGGGKWTPAAPDCDDAVTVTHPRAARLHWGIDGWQLPPESLWPAGTVAYGDGKSVETPMTACEKGFCATLLPFDDAATVVDFVVHNDDGSWDNNGGSDWHIPIAPCGTPDPSEPVPDPAPVPDPGPDPDPEPVPEPVPDAPAEPVPDSPTEPDAASPDAAASDATPATDAPGKDAATGGSGGGSGCSSGPSAGVPAAIVLALLPALALLSRRRRAVALAAAALAAAPAAASADGLVFQATGATQAVGVQAQRAVIWQRADALDLMIEPRFDWEGDGTWVVPLPALPEIAPGDAVFLSELDRLTAPITLTYCRESICHGCQAVPAEGGGRATGASAPVQVWTSGNIGALDYVVLSATEGQDAADWLAGHGFDLPDTAAEAVASLAVEGTYFFAARLGRQAEAGASLPPVRFRFAPTVAPFYPLRLTGAGIGDGMLEVLLWHVSRADGETALSIDGAPRSTGQSAPADGWILEHGGRPADNRLVQGKSSDLGCYTTYPYGGVDVTGSQLGFPTEWTSALTREVIDSGWFVTRLRGRLAAPMLEADVAPGPLPIEEVTFAGVHCVDEGRCPGSGCPPCADEGPEASSPDPAGDGRADASAGDATAGGSGGGGGCASGTPPAPGALALLLLASALLAHAVRRRSG